MAPCMRSRVARHLTDPATRPAGVSMSEREIRYVHHRDTPVDILPEEAVAAIKDATVEVLWRTGIQVRSESLLKQLGAAGAEIDTEDGRARVREDRQGGRTGGVHKGRRGGLLADGATRPAAALA